MGSIGRQIWGLALNLGEETSESGDFVSDESFE